MLGGFGYTMSGSSYGPSKPTFGENGVGMPYPMVNLFGQSGTNQDISFDTSSKDPVMVRCRVFIGNLMRADSVTRDEIIELCKPFGRLLAVTFFKGYAFVQFAEEHGADDACASLDGKLWRGATLDVHLAMAGPANKKKADESFSGRKRRYDDFTREESLLLAPPPPPPEACGVDEAAEQNRRNREVALSDRTTNEDLTVNGMADTLICGSCRFVTCNYEEFKNHRIGRCKTVKAEGEPKSMICTNCYQRFSSAWTLICHWTEVHRMTLFYDDANAGIDSADPIPAKRAPSPSPFFTPMDSSKSHPMTQEEIDAPSNVAPIGKQSVVPVAKLTTEASGADVKPSLPKDEPIGQWNPMTGQTILSVDSLQSSDSSNPPSLNVAATE